MYLILFINFIINGVVFLINKGSNFVYSQFVMCIEIQIVIFYLFLFIKENKISIKEVTIDTALFQSAISIVSFVVPSVQEGIINICIKNGFSITNNMVSWKKIFWLICTTYFLPCQFYK